MKVQEWEERCRHAGCVPKERIHRSECTIYIAETRDPLQPCEDLAWPHFEMMFALGFRGKLQEGMAYKISATHNATYAQRKAKLLPVFEQWIRDNREVGRMTATTGDIPGGR